MIQENTQRLGNDEGDLAPDAVAVALQVIVSDVDAFVSDWLKRLTQSVQLTTHIPTTKHGLLNQIDDFQQEKVRWEDNKRCAEEDIQRKIEQITEAWLRLEAEQRRFLQTKETYSPKVSEFKAESESREHTEVRTVAATTSNDGPFVNKHPSPSPLGDTNVNRSPTTTVQQFQRLRREIESSRPRLGQR